MEVAYFQIDRSWFSLLVVLENYVAGNESVMFDSKSLYRSRAGSHFYGKNMKFGLILGQLAIRKKMGG